MRSRRLARLCLLAAVAAAITLPSSARAATAFVTGDPGAKVLHFDADPGETNSLQIRRVVSAFVEVFSVSDSQTNTIVAGTGCSSNASWTVQCPTDGIVAIDFSLGDGDDTLSSSSPFSLSVPVHVSAGIGADDVGGGSDGPDVIDGGPGNDVIQATDPGADDYHGGEGTDLIRVNRSASQTVSLDDLANDGSLGEGDNVHADFEQVQTGSGDDTIIGTAGRDQLDGGFGGSDVIVGGGGDDTLSGGDGACGVDHDAVFGGDGADAVTIRQAGVADGGAGDDVVKAGLGCGHTTITGGDGRDTVDLRSMVFGAVVSLDGVANDGAPGVLDDNVMPDVETVLGSQGNDLLIGTDGADVLDGGDGDDVLDGARGPDVLIGGGGVDAVDYSTRAAPVTVDLDGQPNDDGEAGEGDSVSSDIEDAFGGDGDDRLTGNAVDNLLDGGPGADELSGLGGIDVVDYSSHTSPMSVDLDGQPRDDGESGEGDTVAGDFEDIIGGAAGDRLTGNGDSNYLDGGGGDDTLDGGGGDDTLDGAGGDDTIDGAGGDDILDGGAGADSLVGALGNDELVSRDDARDDDKCGDGWDVVTADERDIVAWECEEVTGQPRPPAPVLPPLVSQPVRPRPEVTRQPLRPTPLKPPAPAADARPPTVSVKAPARITLANLVRAGVMATVRCSETCTVRGELKADGRTTKRLRLPAVLGTGRAATAQPGTAQLVLRLTAKARKTLTRGRFRSLRLTVFVAAADPAHNARHASRTVIVRR